jgi:hypothetical protein
MTIAKTILNQLGGNKFIAMTGAKNFIDGGQYLSFQLPSRFAKNGINAVKITLTSMDLYDIEFIRVNIRAKESVKIIASESGIYNNDLQSFFTRNTGLATHL